MTAAVQQTPLTVVRAGRVDYRAAWDEQRRLHAAVADGLAPPTVLLLEHPDVYTAGKRTEPWERPVDGTPVVDTDRGGKITWHGPGQIVGYPILRLDSGRLDVVAYVRRMEAMLIAVCAEFGVAAERIKGRTGVWVPAIDRRLAGPAQVPAHDARRPARKVAAIGIRVARSTTQHGFALNCNCDLTRFDRIVPCGITDAEVTSLSRELDREVTVAEVLPVVERHLPKLL